MKHDYSPSRLDTFVDAAFAFALTLLIISFDEIPQSREQMEAALKLIPAFAASFAQLVLFWLGHRRWSRSYGEETYLTVLLSLSLVFAALVFVFPLRIVYSVFFQWLSNGYLAGGFVVSRASDLGFIFAIYGIAFFFFSGLLFLLYWTSWRKREQKALGRSEQYQLRSYLSAWLILALTGLFSTILAFVLKGEAAGYAGMAYATLGISMPINGFYHGKKISQSASG